MKVSHIMNQQSESIRPCFCFIRLYLSHGYIHEGLFIISFILEPLDNSLNGSSNILLAIIKLRKISKLVTLIQVGHSNEMPERLPTTALVPDSISESCTLDERIICLSCSYMSIIRCGELFQCIVYSFQSLRVGLQQVIISDTSNYYSY